MGLTSFLSEENIALHREYLASMRARRKMGLSEGREREINEAILSHELYFSSFAKQRRPCERARRGFGSESAFCYELKSFALTKISGFIYIYPLMRFPYIGYSSRGADVYRARLCIDLFEHAYFLDYAFDLERYLCGALSHLDLSRLDENKD